MDKLLELKYTHREPIVLYRKTVGRVRRRERAGWGWGDGEVGGVGGQGDHVRHKHARCEIVNTMFHA